MLFDDPVEAYTKTNAYAFYFLTNLPRMASCYFGTSPPKRDIELAEELGYKWDYNGDTYKLVPQPGANLPYLLQDAAFKYGFTYDGILREQKPKIDSIRLK